MFIMLDGIDGSGKSTIINAWADMLTSQGKKVFSLKTYWKKFHKHPTADELEPYDVILSAEPTNVWTGAAIREEMIQEGSAYSTNAIADAYALDRLVLYIRVLVPALEAGKMILQDRGVSTSLCYQSIQKDGLSLSAIAGREGNAFALAHSPDHLVIADTPPEVALSRLENRFTKRDRAMFEEKKFLEAAQAQFLNRTFQKYFTSRGTKVHILNSDASLAIMKQNAAKLLSKLLS